MPIFACGSNWPRACRLNRQNSMTLTQPPTPSQTPLGAIRAGYWIDIWTTRTPDC